MTPADCELSDKMRYEIERIGIYPSRTAWTCQGEPQDEECWRCSLCNGLLVVGIEKCPEGRIAQHLVTDHGYTYDGLTPTELEDLCHD